MSLQNPKTGQNGPRIFRIFPKNGKHGQGRTNGDDKLNSKVVYFESKCVYPSRVSTGHGPSGFMKKINSRYMCAKDIGARFFLTHLKTLYWELKSELSITFE